MGVGLSYLRQVAVRPLSRSVGQGDLAGSLIGNLVTVWIHLDPRWETAVSDVLWQIPVFALAGAMALRLLYAPYEVWLDQKRRADLAERNSMSEVPNLTMDVHNIIHGGGVPNMDHLTALIIQISIRNLGKMASSISYTDWSAHISKPGALIPLKFLDVDGRKLVIASKIGDPITIQPDDAIVKKMEKPLGSGCIEHGYIFAVIGKEDHAKIVSGDKLILMTKDIFGKDVQGNWDLTSSRNDDLPFMPFGSRRTV